MQCGVRHAAFHLLAGVHTARAERHGPHPRGGQPGGTPGETFCHTNIHFSTEPRAKAGGTIGRADNYNEKKWLRNHGAGWKCEIWALQRRFLAGESVAHMCHDAKTPPCVLMRLLLARILGVGKQVRSLIQTRRLLGGAQVSGRARVLLGVPGLSLALHRLSLPWQPPLTYYRFATATLVGR